VGKSTVLKKLLGGSTKYVNLDNRIDLALAKETPYLFFKQYSPPIMLDEVQYAPELFHEIKSIIDADKKPGMFYMTGSQAFTLMANVSESLAGRVGVINMQGLSFRELSGDDFHRPFLPAGDFLENRNPKEGFDQYDNIWKLIVRGTLPELHEKPELITEDFYSSYVSTYIERDVRTLVKVTDEMDFMRFITVAAAHTGQLLNYDSIARDVGVSPQTAKRWMSVLQTSGLVYLLQPFYNNIISRAVKTPKLYFLDTGLVCYLTKWKTAEQAATGAMSGALFETLVVSEIMKSYYNNGVAHLPIYFYRDKEQNEIDIIIQENGHLYPIEIKKAGKVDKGQIKAFAKLDGLAANTRGEGAVIAITDRMRYIDENNRLIPLGMV
jgi:predicted AAA+ superfamily ATPase